MLSSFIKDIAQKKKGDLLDLPENELLFSPYVVQRIVSMFSPLLCHIVNETSNKTLSIFDKKEIYKLLLAVVPPQKSAFSRYIKKEPKAVVLTDVQKQAVEMLARRNKLSMKEVERYAEELGLNIDKYTRGLE